MVKKAAVLITGIVAAIDAKQAGQGRWENLLMVAETRTRRCRVGRANGLLRRRRNFRLMDRDGTRDGFDLGLTRSVADAVTVPVVASGGVGNLNHLVDGIVQGHAEAVLAASIFHFAQYTITEAKEVMAAAGIEVRL